MLLGIFQNLKGDFDNNPNDNTDDNDDGKNNGEQGEEAREGRRPDRRSKIVAIKIGRGDVSGDEVFEVVGRIFGELGLVAINIGLRIPFPAVLLSKWLTDRHGGGVDITVRVSSRSGSFLRLLNSGLGGAIIGSLEINWASTEDEGGGTVFLGGSENGMGSGVGFDVV